MDDYYDILGIRKDASIDEIKRAYRKLAHQYHPDKAGKTSEEKFKKINEAYQVLSDPTKRAQYDQFGRVGEGATGWGWQPFGDFGDIFSDFGFGFRSSLDDIFSDFFSQTFSSLTVQIPITISQAVLGDTVSFRTQQGEEIRLNIPPGTQDGETFRFKGKGLLTRRGRGDLIVGIKIKIPRHLTREQKELLGRLKQSGL